MYTRFTYITIDSNHISLIVMKMKNMSMGGTCEILRGRFSIEGNHKLNEHIDMLNLFLICSGDYANHLVKFKCDICLKSFVRKFHFKIYYQSQYGRAAFRLFSMFKEIHLTRSFKSAFCDTFREKPFVCEHCLEKHLRIH